MWHTIFISAHATAATIAMIAGVLAIRRARLFGLYLGSLVMMEVFLVLAIGVKWSVTDGTTRIIFAALAALGAAVVWRGVQARRVRPGPDDAGPSACYLACIGFTLVALADAFIVVAVVNAGAPGWAVATIGVLVASIGHVVLRIQRGRLVLGTGTGPNGRVLT